jgi:two-component system chemotaxis response regulator CheB
MKEVEVVRRDIIVIGASAGGLEAIKTILSAVPKDLDAAIFVVLHTANHSGSLLPAVLGRASKLPVSHPIDWERFEPGRVYIAPPGNHMLVEDGVLRILPGPRENLHCPAIDPLFRSAAVAYGPRVTGVILTGMLDDGTSGLMVVAANGGETIVEDPKTALFSSMPASALEHVPSSHVAPLSELPATLLDVISRPLGPETHFTRKASFEAQKETRIAELDMAEISKDDDRPGQPSPFACPDCGGVLWETDEDNFLRFRCRVGHAFTARYLGAEQRQAIETALWEALRALEESASLYRRMAHRAEASKQHLTASTYGERAANTESNSRVLREFLLQVNQHDGTEDPAVAGPEVMHESS